MTISEPLDLKLLKSAKRLFFPILVLQAAIGVMVIVGLWHLGFWKTVVLEICGAETVIGPVSFSVKPVYDSTFEIISKLKHSDPILEEVSHFSVSSDGMKLTETKTQTEREVVPEGADKPGAVIRSVTSVLVFGKQP
jgi:hypothetical protein